MRRKKSDILFGSAQEHHCETHETAAEKKIQNRKQVRQMSDKSVKKVAFCTLGCKVNQYETDAMNELFSAR